MLTLQQLQKAVSLAEKIQELQSQLDAIIGTPASKSAKSFAIVEYGGAIAYASNKRGPKKGSKRGRKPMNEVGSEEAPKKRGRKKGSKRVMSEEARAKIAEAQKRRWAKTK